LYQVDPIAADDAVLQYDAHWIPNVSGTLERGVLDWDVIAEYLAKAPLDLPPDFEIMLFVDSEEEELEQLLICRREAELMYQKIIELK